MNTEKILNELIAKYGIVDEDVAKLEEAMQADGLLAEPNAEGEPNTEGEAEAEAEA